MERPARRPGTRPGRTGLPTAERLAQPPRAGQPARLARRDRRVRRTGCRSDDDTPVITLREGGTPLLPAPVLSARTGCDVYLKVEGANPTGSFKDRGMTVAISAAAGRGARR